VEAAVVTRVQRFRSERGAALLEFALVLPLLLSLLFGIFTGGAAYFRHISVVDAVREGARYGATLAVATNGETEWKNRVKARVASYGDGQFTAGAVCAELVLPTGATHCGVPDPPGAPSEPTVRLVKVSVSRPVTIEFVWFSLTPTLTAKMAARYERDTG
jgi:Flp pilus assembly protein TadG